MTSMKITMLATAFLAFNAPDCTASTPDSPPLCRMIAHKYITLRGRIQKAWSKPKEKDQDSDTDDTHVKLWYQHSQYQLMLYDVQREWEAADRQGSLDALTEKATEWTQKNIRPEDLDDSTQNMIQLGCSLYCRCNPIADTSFGEIIIKTALTEWVKQHGNTIEAQHEAISMYHKILDKHLKHCKDHNIHIPEAYAKKSCALRGLPLRIFPEVIFAQAKALEEAITHELTVAACVLETVEQEK